MFFSIRTLTAVIAALILVLVPAPTSHIASAQAAAARSARDEVFYQIFVRSFRDSNGDEHGDLKGIEEKLGYLQQLGVTTLLLTPIGPSPFYHNYFLDDFSAIDPAFGTEQDFRRLVRTVHARGMRIFLDMELQYVSGNHVWFTDSYRRPESAYTSYLMYEGQDNTKYQTGFWEKPEVPTYNGRQVRIATVNLLNREVLKLQTDVFLRFLRPSAPARNDGVDGFRIDHMMDDLDGKGTLTDLFARFWNPLFRELKRANPRVRILAEQADWGYGDDFLRRGGADLVFAFPLRKAILSFDKQQLTTAIAETRQKTPEGKQQVLFIENHDVERFASVTGGDQRKAQVGAALNLLLQGIPLLYYGQEIGMTGRQIRDQSSDGGDIPLREAFPWTAQVGPGMATWYRKSGLWWDQSPLVVGGGVSLETQLGKPESLFATYQRLLAVRRSHPAFITGNLTIIENDHAQVLTFAREAGRDRVVVAINLSDAPATVRLAASTGTSARGGVMLRGVLDREGIRSDASGTATVSLAPFGVRIFAASARP
jgi:glycosidase